MWLGFFNCNIKFLISEDLEMVLSILYILKKVYPSMDIVSIVNFQSSKLISSFVPLVILS